MADTRTGTITDPQTVLIGTISITGVLAVNYQKATNMVQARAADGNTRAGAPYLGSEGGYSGSIVFENPYLAQAAERLSGTLSISVKGVGIESDRTCAIAGAVLGSIGAGMSKDTAANATLPFQFGSADGTTDPVSWT